MTTKINNLTNKKRGIIKEEELALEKTIYVLKMGVKKHIHRK